MKTHRQFKNKTRTEYDIHPNKAINNIIYLYSYTHLVAFPPPHLEDMFIVAPTALYLGCLPTTPAVTGPRWIPACYGKKILYNCLLWYVNTGQLPVIASKCFITAYYGKYIFGNCLLLEINVGYLPVMVIINYIILPNYGN